MSCQADIDSPFESLLNENSTSKDNKINNFRSCNESRRPKYPASTDSAVWVDGGQGCAKNSRLCPARLSLRLSASTRRAPLQEVASGYSVWIDAGEIHWHRSAPGRTMVHLAIQETDEHGVEVVWMEYVGEQQRTISKQRDAPATCCQHQCRHGVTPDCRHRDTAQSSDREYRGR